MGLENAKKMLQHAYENKYAIPHININNLEGAKLTLEVANELKSPLILSASPSAIKYLGGFNVSAQMVKALILDLNIKIPVALHLDHGSYNDCVKALESGFTSVMYDGSHEPFEVNLKDTNEIVKLAKKHNASVEAELGTIGYVNLKNDFNVGEFSNLEEVKEMIKIDIDCLAIGIGNVHGNYPKSWKSLNFDLLKQINKIAKMPLVLHGGSGIPEDQIKKSIQQGIAKININTELQIANANAIKQFVILGEINLNKNYDPRKIALPGIKAMKEVLKNKFALFNSINKINWK